MAKGNIILGQMRGSIGDIVFWRGNGEQLSRSRNRRPANPRTDSQLTTRIILKTCSTAYSKLMFDYANQTFQGAKIGAENQRKFMSANTKILRDYIKLGYDDMNFNGKDDVVAMLNRYRVSEGNLPSLGAMVTIPVPDSSVVSVGQPFTIAGTQPTYQEICDAFGVAPGTQLTFLLCNIRQGTINYVIRKRVILSPASGDMSVPFIANGAINDPNPANDAQGLMPIFSSSQLSFEAFGNFQAVAVAASYYDGTKWQYSTEQIWYNPTAGLGFHSLSQAIASWQVAIAGSEEYTRQSNVPETSGGETVSLSYSVSEFDDNGTVTETHDGTVAQGGTIVSPAEWQGDTAGYLVRVRVPYAIDTDLFTVTGADPSFTTDYEEADEGFWVILNAGKADGAWTCALNYDGELVCNVNMHF